MPTPASARNGHGTDPRHVLVIGCGFIGSHVTLALLDSGRRVGVLTRSPPPEEVATRLDDDDLVLADATRPDVLAGALSDVGDVVLCAGGLLPAASERAPELDSQLTLGLVEAVLDGLRARPG